MIQIMAPLLLQLQSPLLAEQQEHFMMALMVILIPLPLDALIVAIPTLNASDWIISAVNVDPDPTIPCSDFISETPYEVTAIETNP